MPRFRSEFWTDLQRRVSNLWFSICWPFFTKKQKRAWRIKPWRWKQESKPIVCYGDGLMTETEQAMFIKLMSDRMAHQTIQDGKDG